jgi:tetratricopeptide (TPR) repeat protein
MFDKEQYSEIIEKYGSAPRIASAEELAYVAESYFRLNNLTDASRYADMALHKSAKCAQALYVKGATSGAAGNYADALRNLQEAVSLAPKNAQYYTGLGDVYFAQENYSEALANYRKAISLPEPSEKAYYMIAAVHADRDEVKQALDTFYIARSKVVKDKELYATILYNIGKMEYDAGNYKGASVAYQELTEYFPDDYYSYEKLVECYNILGYYTRADLTERKLYDAYQNGQLWTTGIADKFCIDHFTAGDKEVSAYERYETSPCRTVDKYLFYIVGADGNIDSMITLEYTPSAEEGKPGRYDPIMFRGSDKYGFNIVYDGDMSYQSLRSSVIDLVEGKTEMIPYAK